MRTFRIAIAAFVLLAGSAAAETRTFIITNNSGGYGVDRCLAGGESCGKPIAAAYCHAQSFADLRSFRKIERDEITGAIPHGRSCTGPQCDELVAIECSR